MPPDAASKAAKCECVAAVRWKLTLGCSTPYPSTTRPLPASNRGWLSGWASVPTSRPNRVARHLGVGIERDHEPGAGSGRGIGAGHHVAWFHGPPGAAG